MSYAKYKKYIIKERISGSFKLSMIPPSPQKGTHLIRHARCELNFARGYLLEFLIQFGKVKSDLNYILKSF